MLSTPSPVRPGNDEIIAQAEAPTSSTTAGSSSGTSSHSSGLESDIEHRLSIVERAIRLQMAVGASHLQQIEMDPAAFGVPSAARSSVQQLRRERNRALHGVDPIASGRSSTDEFSNSLEKLTTGTVAKHSAELIGRKQVDEKHSREISEHVPRCVFVDLEPTVVDEVRKLHRPAGIEKHSRGLSEVKGLMDELLNSLEKLTTDTVAKHSAESIGIQVDEIEEADFAFWGGPYCPECGAKVAACTC